MLKRVAPLSYEAWIDYDVCGAPLSRMELSALQKLVAASPEGISASGGKVDKAALAELGLSAREIEELVIKLTAVAPPDFEIDPKDAVSGESFSERFAAAVPKVDKPPPA